MKVERSRQRHATLKRDKLDEANWHALDPDALQFEHRYGNSVLMEFVRGHTDSDILRELIQNEYDAGGNSLNVIFGEDALHIRGNGEAINDAGWARLSVTLGTGQVAGSNTTVQPKINGIGSKNFGLRSLFVYGDEIQIRSGGLQTILNIREGALPRPQPEPSSKSLRGVHIRVPYRASSYKASEHVVLEPFTEEREQGALEVFATDLAPALVKLSEPSSGNGLNRVAISSVDVSSRRCDRRLTWHQEAKEIFNRDGLRVIRRRVKLSDTALSSSIPTTRVLEEIEFQRSLAIPIDLRGGSIPRYFRVPGGRIRLGLSMRVKRGKLETGHNGLYYYPLGVPQGYTGNAVSINAPFNMDADRSHLIDPSSNRWNSWLIDEAVDLSFKLLTSYWFDEYKAEAYMALLPTESASTAYYTEKLNEMLATKPCWPTRAPRLGRKGKPSFACATDIVLPDHPVLDGFLAGSLSLDADLVENQVLTDALRNQYGAKLFSINSLVRLRCAGKDGSHLSTKLDTEKEPSYYYMNFPEPLRIVSHQERLSIALNALERRFSKENKDDLEKSATTLAADDSLHLPSALWVVDEAISNITPVSDSERLHPILQKFKVIVKLCKKYDAKKWVRETTQLVLDGEASIDQITDLYKYVLATHGSVDRTTWALLRKAPILKDHRGDWVPPSAITLRKAQGALALEAALHFPNSEYENDEDLAKAFRFRRNITGQDIVDYAQLIPSQPDLGRGFEDTLDKYKKYLSGKKYWSTLSSIPFLESSSGRLAAPITLYLRNTKTVACLGPRALYVVGSRNALYSRLGCMDKPGSKDIISYLTELLDQNVGPPQPQILYPALVEALHIEKTSTTSYQDQQIIWNGSGYHPPSELLLGQTNASLFLLAIPQLNSNSPDVQRAFKALGVPTEPEPPHWLNLFLWYDTEYGNPRRKLPGRERSLLLRAYKGYMKANQPLRQIPISSFKFLLDHNATVYSVDEAKAGQYVINNDPTMAQAINEQEIPVAFAALGDREYSKVMEFYRALGVPFLTEVRTPNGFRYEEPVPAPDWVNVPSVLKQLHSGYFASAIDAVVAHNLPGQLTLAQTANARLQAIEELIFCEGLQVSYKLGKSVVDVSAEIHVEHNRILLSNVTTRTEGYEVLSRGIATLYTTDPVSQNHLSDSVYRIMTYSNMAERIRYLARQGIPWAPPQTRAAGETWEEETAEQDQELSETQMSTTVIPQHDGRSSITDEERTEIIGGLTESLDRRLATPQTAGKPNTSQSGRGSNLPGNLPPPTKVPFKPPPISSLEPIIIESERNWTPPERTTSASGRGAKSGQGSGVDDFNDARKRKIGKYGEEIIYQSELARVVALEYPKSRVVWQSKINPASNYDILSVDDDGSDLFIEVKSTTGEHGRFEWPMSEFNKACEERKHYILWRVYQVGNIRPTLKSFRDPIGMIGSKEMRVDFAVLSGEVEPLDTTGPS